ncbi:MAG: hypothetical protein O3B73_08740, partial [bacterium]|nr:hypothetical protein [bacterium]
EGMSRAGLHEYNARPYLGYTLTALLNLEAFTSEPVRSAARKVLDRVNWEYALGSLSFRRFPPFRRQPGHARDTDLDGDYHTGVMKAWMSLAGVDSLAIRKGEHQALWVPLTSYRPSDAVAEWVLRKPENYFIQMGHGLDGSSEIYSGGPGHLITGGGIANDWARQCVARPITLMVDDGAMFLPELMHAEGPGTDYREWNNTGVHRNFAVSAGPVSVPATWERVAENSLWRIFERAGKQVAVHSTGDVGIFCVLPVGTPEAHLSLLTAANADADLLKTRFQWPGGDTLTYDIRAPKDLWVIVSVNGEPADRDHLKWPLMRGEVPGWSQ